MIYPDEDDIAELKRRHPHGQISNDEAERRATWIAVRKAIDALEDGPIKEILDTIAELS